MNNSKIQKNQKLILDFFKKTTNNPKENVRSSIQGISQNISFSPSPRKRKRAISKKVKKVVNGNKKRKIETISLSDESDFSEDDMGHPEALFKLEETMTVIKNETLQSILYDWHTPEKVSNHKDVQGHMKCHLNENEASSETFNKENNTNIKKPITPANGIKCFSGEIEHRSLVSVCKQNDIFEDYKIKIENTPIKPIQNSLKESDCNSSFNSSRKTSKICSPERTPTPSPLLCHQSSSSVNYSPYIRSSPGKFNLSKALSSPESKANLNRNVKNTTIFANSSCYGNSVKRQLSMESESSNPDVISDKQIKLEGCLSPSKYRKVNGLYLDNFHFVMTSVMSSIHNTSLFNEEDNRIIDNFKSLSLEAKKFYVRLFQRKVRWLNFNKISYGDICEKEDTYIYLNELIYSEFLDAESQLEEVKTILDILERKELHQLCKDFKVKPLGTRENIIDNLIKNSKEQKTILSLFGKQDQGSLLLKRAKSLLGRCFILNKEARNIFMRVLTLFSLPAAGEDEDAGQQSQLKILLMQKLGKLEFPSYEVVRSCSIFSCRDSLMEFTECYQLDCKARDLMEQKEWDKAIEICIEANVILIDLLQNPSIIAHDTALPSFLRRFTSISVLLYIQSYLVDALQRLKRYDEAVKGLQFLLEQKVHLQDSRGRWYDRLALNYDQHLRDPERALLTITEALNDPEVMTGHRLALSQRAERIMNSKRGKKYEDIFKEKISLVQVVDAPKIVIQANSLPSDAPGFKRIYIEKDSTSEETTIISSVEEMVLSHYKKQGYQFGLHCEGRSVRTIFGLLFWDCIYAAIPDVFMSSYQGAPLDLNSKHFYEARKDSIDKRLTNIRRMSIEDVYEDIEKIWIANEGKVSVVNWTVFVDVEHVKSLVTCLGIQVIAAICERLCKNHRFTRSGFPDLIVWNRAERTSRIVEVKGPNDKLSTKQILWLEFLNANGATAEVCHVEALGARRPN